MGAILHHVLKQMGRSTFYKTLKFQCLYSCALFMCFTVHCSLNCYIVQYCAVPLYFTILSEILYCTFTELK